MEQRKRFEEEMARSGPQLDNIEEDEGDDYVDAYPQEEDEGERTVLFFMTLIGHKANFYV